MSRRTVLRRGAGVAAGGLIATMARPVAALAGQRKCGQGTYDTASQQCCPGVSTPRHPCNLKQKCCGTNCCNPDQTCHDETNDCCNPGQKYCGVAGQGDPGCYTPSTHKCCEGFDVAHSGQIGVAGLLPDLPGSRCPNERNCCGLDCCKKGEFCCAYECKTEKDHEECDDGKQCCGPDQMCCGEKTCCNPSDCKDGVCSGTCGANGKTGTCPNNGLCMEFLDGTSGYCCDIPAGASCGSREHIGFTCPAPSVAGTGICMPPDSDGGTDGCIDQGTATCSCPGGGTPNPCFCCGNPEPNYCGNVCSCAASDPATCTPG